MCFKSWINYQARVIENIGIAFNAVKNEMLDESFQSVQTVTTVSQIGDNSTDSEGGTKQYIETEEIFPKTLLKQEPDYNDKSRQKARNFLIKNFINFPQSIEVTRRFGTNLEEDYELQKLVKQFK